MSSRMIPDHIFANIFEITPDFLLGEGICALVLDIDNTLVTYDDPVPTEHVLGWLGSMTDSGIAIAFVSNNDHKRVELFNRELGYFGRGKSAKPFGRTIRAAMAHMGSTPATTALIGDQIFTDILAGKAQGLRSYLVPPIKDKTTLFFRAKRLLEKPFLRRYHKKHKDDNK